MNRQDRKNLAKWYAEYEASVAQESENPQATTLSALDTLITNLEDFRDDHQERADNAVTESMRESLEEVVTVCEDVLGDLEDAKNRLEEEGLSADELEDCQSLISESYEPITAL